MTQRPTTSISSSSNAADASNSPTPGRSLVLAKPTGAIPHKGGVRFATDSREYQIIADWIASGAEPPRDV